MKIAVSQIMPCSENVPRAVACYRDLVGLSAVGGHFHDPDGHLLSIFGPESRA